MINKNINTVVEMIGVVTEAAAKTSFMIDQVRQGGLRVNELYDKVLYRVSNIELLLNQFVIAALLCDEDERDHTVAHFNKKMVDYVELWNSAVKKLGDCIEDEEEAAEEEEEEKKHCCGACH